jgi:nucleoside-diphosphate-sugar epimerase
VTAPSPRVLADTDGDRVVLGAGGKVGISLATMAARAFASLPGSRTVYAVSRFSDESLVATLDAAGVRPVRADLLDDDALAALPDAANVAYLVGRKFGTSASPAASWALNAYLPGRVIRRYAGARVVAYSSGNVYPFVPIGSGGATESVGPDPIGEYAQSCLARERVLEYFAAETGTPLTLFRLNYAIDCRYGVLSDLAATIESGRPVDLGAGAVNVLWQGDANRYALGGFGIAAATPPTVLNATGPETASVRYLATELGARIGAEPTFTGIEPQTALLSNAGRCFGHFGYPSVTLQQMLDWTVQWRRAGGELLDRPTHFAERAGAF